MQIMTIPLVFAWFGWSLFLIFGMPVWSAMDSVGTKEFSKGKKIFWTAFIVLLWGIGPSIYGSFVSKNRKLKATSLIGLLTLMGALLFNLTWMPIQNQKKIAGLEERLKSVSFEDARSLPQIKSDLSDLKAEFAPFKLNFRQSRKNAYLVDILQALISDQRLSQDEYASWRNLFEARLSIERRALYEKWKKLKRPRISSPAQQD